MTDIGSQGDVSRRLFQVLPPSWFPNPAPNINALLQGFAAIGATAYSLIAFAKAQTRLLTSTGIFVDLFGFSYLGRTIKRAAGEADAAYAGRVQTEILRERATRAGMSKALLDLTGSAPVIFEPWNTGDAGALNIGTLALANAPGTGAIAVTGSITPNLVGNYTQAGTFNGAALYQCPGVGFIWFSSGIIWVLSANLGDLTKPDFSINSAVTPPLGTFFPNTGLGAVGNPIAAPGTVFGGAGAVGSIILPSQVLITVPAVSLQAIPNVAGLGSFLAGLGTGSFEIIDGADATGPVTTAGIYETINNTKPTGVSAWVQIL